MFDRLSLPTPFDVGQVNAYLADRTLIDPGPDTGEAWAALSDSLAVRGLAPGDLERVVITHPHPDHSGLAARLRDEGASVVASPDAAPILADFGGRLAREADYFGSLFERHGVPPGTAATVADLAESFVEYAPDVETDRTVREGERIGIAGHEVEVLEVAGHATGELVFAFDADGDRRAVVGDHVLGDVTSNPLLQPPPTDGGDRPRVLPAFNRSLARLREMGFDRMLPGHGDPIEDPAGRIDAILAAHEERTGRTLELVEGPTTAWEVMEGLFDDLPVIEYFAGMSEAIGHLDVLEERSAVVREVRDDRVVYRRA